MAYSLTCDVLKAVVNLALDALKAEDMELYNNLMKLHDDIVQIHLPSFIPEKTTTTTTPS